MATLPGVDAIMVDGGVSYTRKICVNLVDRNTAGTDWTSTCPDSPLTPATDKGLKNVRIWVAWQSGSQSYSVETEGLVTR